MNVTGTQEPASIHTRKKVPQTGFAGKLSRAINWCFNKKTAKLLEWQKLSLKILYLYLYIYIYKYKSSDIYIYTYMIYVYDICIWCMYIIYAYGICMYLFVYLQAIIFVSLHPTCTFTRSGSNHYGPLPAVSPALFPWSGKVQCCVRTAKFTQNPDCPF